MNIRELIAQAKANSDGKLDDISEGKAATLIRNVFASILEQVERAEPGIVRVGGLGVFRTQDVERSVDGSTVLVRRILFRPKAAVASDIAGDAKQLTSS